MKKLLLISLLLTSACSSWGNDPASQFANVTYDENYYRQLEIMRAAACEMSDSSCTPYYVSSY